MRALLQRVLFCALALIGQSALAAPDKPIPPRFAFWVDLRRALLSTKDGKELATEIDRVERELARLEQEIETNTKPEREDLDRALTAAETRLLELETKKVQPLAEEVRGIIKSFNDASKDVVILETDHYDPINLARACDATDWLVQRLEKPGKKPIRKRKECAVKFFFYVDIDRLKSEMNATATQRITLESLRDDRLKEISSSTSSLSRLQMFQRYAEQEKLRRELERRTDARMTLAATAFIIKTAKPMRGVLFLGDDDHGAKMAPSCDVTNWLIKLEQGGAMMEDVAHDCSCVWLNRTGTKIRIQRGCGG
jgi:hypothetical protein